ncbi:helix-turn-helix domain containing protein [Thalassococcus sp. CAU 1522]|uniref:Helix-turn-helix domain containing protein n=1 Tax=Thalassococcus arenae TaxID=2851652 RepID=A0ABS6NAS3_9RHOB|nr:DUF6456 domain-containing protein [Thalassococcus arenae]MBV2361131.1 helix-turn-helix domain containing protein [Thalassococcus arenae]
MAPSAYHSGSENLPGWVPEAARLYLAHTENGRPIRALARELGCHASTVLRKVRKIETRRDDPLVDAALRQLCLPPDPNGKKECEMTRHNQTDAVALDEATLLREARRVLHRLCESGAMLAVAADMEKAVVVRDNGEGSTMRTAVVDAPVAEAMALKAWIHCDAPGRISRYRITASGRAAFNRIVAEKESRIRGFAESQAGFENSRAVEQALDDMERDPATRRGRSGAAESPLAILSRRRDKTGKPFLEEALVAAGERLREDYELAQVGFDEDESWAELVAGDRWTDAAAAQPGSARARERMLSALRDLGPGLGDVALRCCCYLEGLETTEKRMGWSARSGKIVLRIALQRLRRHYAERAKDGGDLIG